MKAKWRRRGRGAISIFLIIIFVAQYAFCGLLVDGARHRMAEAMAESALDSASMSVLSYYNQLVYDLYGLMATDSLSEEEIKTKLTSYVEKTLGTAEVNAGLIQKIVSLVDTDDTKKGFDGYDFQLSVEAEPNVSLASTDFVEYQIIEHMKYRAPLLLLGNEDGLLSKLKGLTDVAERLDLAKKRLEIVNNDTNKENMKTASNTLNSIKTFIGMTRAFVNDPVNWDLSKTLGYTPDTPADVAGYVKTIDRAADDLAEDYLEEWDSFRLQYTLWKMEQEDPSSAGYGAPEPEPPEWTNEDWREKFQTPVNETKEKYAAIVANAAKLRDSANALIGWIDRDVANYGSYISQVNTAYRNSGGDGNSNAATVFLPEAELAEANAGQLLKNRPFLSYVATFAGEIANEDTTKINRALNDIVFGSETSLDGMVLELSKNLEDSVEGYPEDEPEGGWKLPDPPCTYVSERISASALGVIPGDLDQLRRVLNEDAFPNLANSEVDVKVDGKQAKEDAKTDSEKADTAGLRDIDADDLRVDFASSTSTAVKADADALTMGDDIDADTGEAMLNAAGGVLDVLMEMLEGARDNLYVNQYITYYFPNYVDCYKLTGDKIPEYAKRFTEGDYKDYCANQVEVEYVLTGEPNGRKSVLEVQAMLLGIRTAFNLIAVFTDSAKISQANALAAAAGPFAPLVSIALLIGWAVAESVIDVQKLCAGEKVPLFKQGKDWFLSVEGAVENVIRDAAEYVVGAGIDFAKKKINSITGKVQNVANQAIYAAYNAASGGLDEAQTAVNSTVGSWTTSINTSLNSLSGQADVTGVEEVRGALNEVQSGFSNIKDVATDKLDDVKDKAIKGVNKAAENVNKNVSEKLTSVGDKISGKLADSLSGWVSDKIPVGKVVNSGETDSSELLGLTYMDYIQIFLLLESQDKKVKRVQELVQANICYKEKDSGSKKFMMKDAYGAIQAKLDGSIKFLFMSEAIIPAELRQSGRLKFSVNSSVSY